MSLRARLTLIGTATAVVIVVLFGALVDLFAQSTVNAQRDQVLSQLSEQAGPRVAAYSPAILRRATVATPVDVGAGSAEFVEVFDSGGAVAYSSGLLHGGAVQLPIETLRLATDVSRPVASTVVVPGATVRVSVLALTHLGSQSGGWVVAGESTSAVQESLAHLTGVIVTVAVLLLGGGATASWFLARRSLRPLRLAAATAQAVREDRDLSRRLPPTPHPDEVGRLAASFNAMMDNLELTHHELDSALTSQRRFVADASHELRTPLTSIRSNVEFLRDHADAAVADRAAALADIEAEGGRMVRLVDDLLALARADAGQHLDLQPVALGPLVERVGRQAAQVYADRHLAVRVVPSAVVLGDDDALTQLVWILINNAAHHTAVGGDIAVHMSRTARDALLEVTDDGAGIPEPDLRRIFERFYQVDAARGGGGAGLGLSIATWIVAEHHGAIEAANMVPHGARFSVRIPFSADS